VVASARWRGGYLSCGSRESQLRARRRHCRGHDRALSNGGVTACPRPRERVADSQLAVCTASAWARGCASSDRRTRRILHRFHGPGSALTHLRQEGRPHSPLRDEACPCTAPCDPGGLPTPAAGRKLNCACKHGPGPARLVPTVSVIDRSAAHRLPPKASGRVANQSPCMPPCTVSYAGRVTLTATSNL
jgi:hypothetical protein